MDAIFALAAGPRARVLERAAARVPGCLYLCLWAPVIGRLPASYLFCLDAWIGNGGGGDRGDRALAMFEAYRGALCAVVSGCVPGWAYKEGHKYMALPEPDLTASASLQVQQQFYQEAGTKMAVFMECESGEIEVGLSITSVAAAAVANHVQQSLQEELLLLPPTQPSSSSSSLPSLSIGSPEYTTLIRSIATSVAAAGEPSPLASPPHVLLTPIFPSAEAADTSPRAPQPSPLHGLLAPFYGQHEFPSAEADDDIAMAQAMLAVISSSDATATSTPPPPPCPPWLASHRSQSQRTSPRRRATAFRTYNAALSPRSRPRPGAPGQRMIKTCITLLVSVHNAMRNRELAAAPHHEEGIAQQPPPPPSSSQLHHMISERRRRERLNDSFQTLRALLPHGSKKDKANVLASTTEYMNKLISQVSDLHNKNLQLEAQLGLRLESHNQTGASDDSSARVHVDVTTGASTSTTTPNQPREVIITVTVRAEHDMSELLISLLARVKEMGRFAVVSVDARQQSSALAQASLTLRAMAGNAVDETSLKEAVTKVVEGALMAPPPESP